MSYLVANPEDRFSRDVAQLAQWYIDTNITFNKILCMRELEERESVSTNEMGPRIINPKGLRSKPF